MAEKTMCLGCRNAVEALIVVDGVLRCPLCYCGMFAGPPDDIFPLIEAAMKNASDEAKKSGAEGKGR